MSTSQELKSILDKKLEEAGEFNSGAAMSFARYSLNHYSNEDWKDYEQDTGNKRPYLVPAPKNGLEAMIDQATGLKEDQDRNFLNFLIYSIDEFMAGFKDE